MPDNHEESHKDNPQEKAAPGSRPFPDIVLNVPRQYLALLLVGYAAIISLCLIVLKAPYLHSLGIAFLLILPFWMYGSNKCHKDPSWFKRKE